TLLGLSAEYALWDNSFVEMTLLYMNQKTLDDRVQVGGEPLRNSIWDINTQLTFEPMFLTRAVDWLPLIETDATSTFTINAEVAQVFPEPNSLNSPSTGDHNGVAYLDDFESIRRSTPLGIGRKLWTAASFPEHDRRGELEWKKQRGRLIWYNPEQIKITDIWPEREVEATSATTPVLQLEFQPWWGAWEPNPPDDNIDHSQSWGGIMRYLGAGYADQSESKYIEIWLKRGHNASGVMYIDLGRISEDVIPNARLDTEDQPIGNRSGNGILDDGEDTGLDGVAGNDGTDEADSTYVNDSETLLPSYDDWNYSFQNSTDYTTINGTEDNGKLNGGNSDEGGRYPDTEDLNGNTFLDQSNSFMRYRVDLGEGDQNRYIVGGLATTSENKGWRLYRIPLTDTLEVNDPSLTTIDYVRIWFTGFDKKTNLTIAQVDIVGNEWQEVEAENNRGETYDPLSVAVTNTHDNPEYNPPPGVAGEIDPATGLRGQEQSLVLRINGLGTGETGTVEKKFYRDKYLLEYRQLKMFVSGGGASERLVDRFGRELDLELFLRFGDGQTNSRRYYEYSQRLYPGWSSENEIIIDFDRLSSLKFLRQQDSLRNYDILPNGDVIRVVGEPSLTDIGFLTIGIKNHGQPITAEDEVEIWVDELRVSDIQSDPGWAATGKMDLKVADLLTLSGDLEHRQAAFHNVNTRVQQKASDELSGNLRLGFNLDRFFPTQWGLKLPISATFRQQVDIPQYQPGSDIELSSISDERIDIWSVFEQNLWDNSRLYGNIPNPNPMDSMITTSKQYDMSFRASKGKKSDNIWIRSTIDGLSFSTGINQRWHSGPTYRFDNNRTIKGETAYSFSFEEPLEVMWLGWTKSIPFLGGLSESVLRPLPSSLSFSMNGTETIISKESRAGRLTDTHTLYLSRRFRTSWRPLSSLSADFSMDINSTCIPNDSLRTNIARS
ncbi:MAG: cell surface protein SprA, partial [Candidatus Electryoneaceae bacterium]|nr:cell surface protein SprA [Candidatus Electryoneaceae bacterium]